MRTPNPFAGYVFVLAIILMMSIEIRLGQWRAFAPGRRLCALTIVAFVVLSSLLSRHSVAQAQDGIPIAPAEAAAATLTLSVSTPRSGGFVTTTDVINSQTVTYKIRFANATGAAVTGLEVAAPLPTSGLEFVSCQCPESDIKKHTVKIINALGEEEEQTVPYELNFKLGSIANNGTVERTFEMRVVGQAGGTTVENTALAFFNSTQSTVSNKVTMEVVADVPQQPVTQLTAVSDTPNWFSDDLGGTLDLDWADVDNDGDLDLALASTVGTGVYLNNNGQLISIWVDPEARVTYGVRWVDVNNDGTPELVAVGSPNGDVAGTNYVFKFNPGEFTSPDRFTLMPNGIFPTTNQLTRIETGHFNDDQLPDLLLSVNAISAECPVFILFNEGANLYKGAPKCVSTAATAAIQTGDVNKDGLVDLALGIFPNQVRVIINASGVLSQTNPSNILIDPSNKFLPYDFAWGDIDGDGDLDLAAAFPLQREVRIYRNTSVSPTNVTFAYLQSLTTSVFQTPYAIELADLDRDGGLDLVVGDADPTIYWNTRNVSTPFSASAGNQTVLNQGGARAEIWAIRAIDQDGNGSLELSFANRDGPSMLLANYSTSLASNFTPITGGGAGSSVAWGDVNNDGFNDLFVGSPPDRNSSRLFINKNGAFVLQNASEIDTDQIGGHAVALGDLNPPSSGGSLDTITLMPTGLEISYNGGAPQTVAIPGLAASLQRVVATGDMDGDGDLDLAVGLNPGGLFIVENRAGESPSTPNVFAVAGAPNDVSSLDWGDVDQDHYLDLAIGSGAGLTVLVNNSDNTFRSLGVNTIVVDNGFTCLQGRVQAVSWGDVNGDGWPDLAVGAAGQPGCVLQNAGGKTLRTSQQFNPAQRSVTSLDWGDWDNDGDLDLAVAYASGPVQVHSNTAGRLFPLWQSTQTFAATSVRWGDKDGDSDLDLALARTGGDSGYFENRLVEPGHLLGAADASLIPNPSAYAYVRRPGVTRSAYDYSTSEILASSTVANIPVSFRLFKPDGDDSDPAQLYTLLYHYSLNGGGSWLKATPAPGQTTTISTTLTREGQDFSFLWNARADKAISEKALFRVSVINPSNGSTVQNAVGVGISPPFQARATTCIWPADPGILIDNVEAVPGRVFVAQNGATVDIAFGARLAQGTGVMTFNWALNGNQNPKQGQRVSYTVGRGEHEITMTANGRGCPVTRSASKTYKFTVNVNSLAFMPMVMTQGEAVASGGVDLAAIDAQQAAASGATVFDAGMESTDTAFVALDQIPRAAQVTDPVIDLDGLMRDDALTLTWRLGADADITGLWVYRQPQDGGEAVLEAAMPAGQTLYTTAASCGVTYSIVAIGESGEIPAQQEYRTPPCQTGGAE